MKSVIKREMHITPINQLAATNVVTVEVSGQGGLHPAQEAMIEKHASQCGLHSWVRVSIAA